MEQTIQLLSDLVQIPGVSGHEKPVRDYIQKLWQPLTDELQVSRLGSVHGLRRAAKDNPGNSILITAHMDQIGLMVSHIESGLLRVTNIGSLNQSTLPGLSVNVHSKEGDIPGVIVLPPDHTLPDDVAGKVVPLQYLWVDTGLPHNEVDLKVRTGDLVSFSVTPQDMGEGYFTAAGLDNRAGVATLTEMLKLLRSHQLSWDVWAAATSQEEIGHLGARTSAFEMQPTLAVAIDTNYGTALNGIPGVTFKLNGGPTLDYSPYLHRKLFEAFEMAARDHQIPFQPCVYPRESHSDADDLQVVKSGIPTMLIGIPLRNMHSPVEMIQIKDIQRAASLLAVFIQQLDANFMDSLRWDEELEVD